MVIEREIIQINYLLLQISLYVLDEIKFVSFIGCSDQCRTGNFGIQYKKPWHSMRLCPCSFRFYSLVSNRSSAYRV